MSSFSTHKFNFRGRKYTVSFDDGGIVDVESLPADLLADPRFQRLVSREQEDSKDVREYCDDIEKRGYR
jgi:hypothetical protein